MLRDCGLPDDEPKEGCTFRRVGRRYLLNVARNFVGSIGISLANTELMQRVQLHQSRLVESAIPSSSDYQHTLDRVAEFFVSQGSSLITAQQQAVGWIGQTILNQAALGMRRVMQMPDNAGTDGVGYGFDYPVFSIDRYHPRRNSWRDKVAARFVARCSV
jgi:hypothetical protein